MCIFCERARASLDDPLAGLDGVGGWDADNSTTTGGSSSRFNRVARGSREATLTLHQKREAERCDELKRRARLPVTVITGFLGAGKTTFVNHLLSARHGRKLAVIENEFGEVAIDDALLGDGGVERGEEAQQVILMPNGCMCCRVRGDLVDALKRLIVSASERASLGDGDAPPRQQQTQQKAAKSPPPPSPGGDQLGDAAATAVAPPSSEAAAARDTATTGGVRGAPAAVAAAKLDGIILECSGLDELAPVLQTFFADLFVQEHVRLDAVVCLCDSPRLVRTLMTPPPPPLPPTIAEGNSDAKSSTPVEEGGEEEEEAADSSAAAAAATLVKSQLALSDRVLLNKSDLISPAQGDALVDAVKANFPGASVTRCERGKVDVDLVLGVDSFSLDKALEMDKHFADILADKKNNSDKHDRRHHHGEAKANTPPHGGAEKSASAATSSRGREHRHAHDRLGAQSVGVEVAERPIDWAKFTSWLKGFLEKEGEELIWRLKGVLWTTAASGSGAATTWGWGAGRRTVVQGLYGHFESEVSDWPAGATRVSRMVFIGDLCPRVQEALQRGVRSCVASRRARPLPPKPRAIAGRERGSGVGGGGGGFASRLGSVKFGGGENDLFL
ncbi:unnamed protein product [Ectocarpus sp. CCAP 1310/34]|nr:unnamed protein product [Ectocarpus sp. CCAP 1310/34]